MPAKRLPWFRFWIDATTHGKVRQLDDATFRTWVELLDAAAKQPRRGRFDNEREAASVVRRPSKHIATLISAKLIDKSADGLMMHDWDEWQRWRQDDVNDTPTTTDEPPNGYRNGHTNDSRTTREQLVNDPSLRVRAEGDTETEREINTPLTPHRGERKPVPKPKPDRKLIAEEDIDHLVGKYADQYGNRQAVRDEIDQALNHQARFRAINERLYVDGWLRRELQHRPGWRVLDGRRTAQTHAPVDRTGVAN